MPLLTIEQCRDHCRVIDDQNDSLLEDALEAATNAAADYLNRTIFESGQQMADRLAALPDEAVAAQAAYDAAMAAAAAEPNKTKADIMRAIACKARDESTRSFQYALNGVVATPSIVAAVKMILGHLFENPEAVTAAAGVTVAIEFPLGATDMLRPHRRRMMP